MTGSSSEGMRTAHTGGIIRAGSTMAAGTLVSRATGFLAKVVILAFLGFATVNDAYNLANTLPNIIFELLIGGVLTSVAIPLLSRARADPDGGEAYTQRLLSLAVVALLLATGAAMATAPLLTRLYQSGTSADPVLATRLAYLLLPQIIFYGIAALFGAILNTKERFAAPAWAPVINNLVVIGVGATLLTTAGGSGRAHGLTELGRGQFLLLGIGTTAGIVLQAAVLLPALLRSGFRFRWRWGLDSRMAEAGRLMAWAIGYVLVSQAGYVVTANIAYAARGGFYALYNYGSMLFQLPYGILGVSLLTAIMPRMSRHAAAGEMAAVKHDMAVANRLSAVALLPVSAAMIALALPLAIVTAQYGEVAPSDVRILAFTLAAFAIGLLPLAVTLVQMRVFYAAKDGRTPTLINLAMVGVRIPLLLSCQLLPEQWVVPGLAAAMSVSYLIGVVVGEVWLRFRFGSTGSAATLATVGRTALAAAAGGLAAWFVTTRVLPLERGTLGVGVIAILLGGVVGLIVTGAGLLLLQVQEVGALRRLLSRRRHVSAPRHGTLVGADGLRGAEGHGEGQGREPVTDQHNNGAPAPDAARVQRAGEPSGAAPRSEPGDPVFSPGSLVGERYRLLDLIAVDAAGNRFWQARDTVLPRDMAVTLLPGLRHTDAAVTRTLRAGRLHHIGLPQTLDVGTIGTDGEPTAYIVGQWVDGATLTDLISGGPLEPEVASPLITKIADAVAEAHRNGIALGAIHPSVVRVNFDGSVRLSHVVAQVDATTDADIRATGALLYLMLTGAWTLDPADGAPRLPLAPMRHGREVPAAEVNPAVPAALSALVERTLHPDDPQGVRAIGAVSALLRPAGPPSPAGVGGVRAAGGSGGASGSGAAGGRRRRATGRPGGDGTGGPGTAGAPDPGRTDRAERTATKDRRIKLSIAGAMLAALAVLIVIMGASLAKQFLTSIVEPIKASDQQQLIVPTTPTTTRTVGTSQGGTSLSTGTGTSGSSGSGQTSSAMPAEAVTVADATVYDPQGTPPLDNEGYVDRAFDGDQGTYWVTWVYRQQFGKSQGGLKDGVGLLLTFATPVTPASVTVSSGTPGTGVEIRSASSADPSLPSTAVLGSAELGADPVSITLSGATPSKYLIVWINKLAPYQGDSKKHVGQFESSITEITVYAR